MPKRHPVEVARSELTVQAKDTEECVLVPVRLLQSLQRNQDASLPSSLDVSQVEALIATWRMDAKRHFSETSKQAHAMAHVYNVCAHELAALLRGGRPNHRT